MTQSIIVTIVIDLPDGATVGVTQGAPQAPTPVAAPLMAELPPPMPQRAPAQDEPPHPAASVGPGQFPPAGVSVGTCSQGHPWKTVPGGVSKRTGKSYDAFTVCDDRDHGEKPR